MLGKAVVARAEMLAGQTTVVEVGVGTVAAVAAGHAALAEAVRKETARRGRPPETPAREQGDHREMGSAGGSQAW